MSSLFFRVIYSVVILQLFIHCFTLRKNLNQYKRYFVLSSVDFQICFRLYSYLYVFSFLQLLRAQLGKKKTHKVFQCNHSSSHSTHLCLCNSFSWSGKTTIMSHLLIGKFSISQCITANKFSPGQATPIALPRQQVIQCHSLQQYNFLISPRIYFPFSLLSQLYSLYTVYVLYLKAVYLFL